MTTWHRSPCTCSTQPPLNRPSTWRLPAARSFRSSAWLPAFEQIFMKVGPLFKWKWFQGASSEALLGSDQPSPWSVWLTTLDSFRNGWRIKSFLQRSIPESSSAHLPNMNAKALVEASSKHWWCTHSVLTMALKPEYMVSKRILYGSKTGQTLSLAHISKKGRNRMEWHSYVLFW